MDSDTPSDVFHAPTEWRFHPTVAGSSFFNGQDRVLVPTVTVAWTRTGSLFGTPLTSMEWTGYNLSPGIGEVETSLGWSGQDRYQSMEWIGTPLAIADGVERMGQEVDMASRGTKIHDKNYVDCHYVFTALYSSPYAT